MQPNNEPGLKRYSIHQGIAGFTLLAFLLIQLVWPFPAFALRVQAGLESASESNLEDALRKDASAGLEEPPWPEGAGKTEGIDEFRDHLSEERFAALRDARTFVERAIVLSRAMGWSDRQFSMKIGNEALASKWMSRRTEVPTPQRIGKVSAVLNADPIFLLTGESNERALRPGPPARRIRLLMLARGMAEDNLAEILGVHRVMVSKFSNPEVNLTRDVLFRLGEAFRKDPSLLETGFQPRVPLLIRPSGEIGFQVGLVKDSRLRGQAEELQEAIIRQWRLKAQMGTEKYPVDQWEREIAPDPDHYYPGLAARLLLARPGSLERAVHYGLLSENVAQALQKRGPLSPPEVAQLASDLARAHEELLELFQAAPQLRPPKGYVTNRKARIVNPWDLIARLMNRERILGLLNRAHVDYEKLKRHLLIGSADPEGVIGKKEKMERQLAPQFPGLPGKAIVNYVWYYQKPKDVLDKAQLFHQRILDLARKGWVRPESFLGTLQGPSPRTSEELANWLIVGGLSKAENLLAKVKRRDAALRNALIDPPMGLLRQIATQIPGLASDLEGPQTTPGYSEARDLLNRVVAWRQVEDPNFFANAPDPEAVDPEDVALYARPFLRDLLAQLQTEEKAHSLPEDVDGLDSFLERIAVPAAPSTKADTAGLEELETAIQTLQLSRDSQERVAAMQSLFELLANSPPGSFGMESRFDPVPEIEQLADLYLALLERPGEGGDEVQGRAYSELKRLARDFPSTLPRIFRGLASLKKREADANEQQDAQSAGKFHDLANQLENSLANAAADMPFGNDDFQRLLSFTLPVLPGLLVHMGTIDDLEEAADLYGLPIEPEDYRDLNLKTMLYIGNAAKGSDNVVEIKDNPLHSQKPRAMKLLWQELVRESKAIQAKYESAPQPVEEIVEMTDLLRRYVKLTAMLLSGDKTNNIGNLGGLLFGNDEALRLKTGRWLLWLSFFGNKVAQSALDSQRSVWAQVEQEWERQNRALDNQYGIVHDQVPPEGLPPALSESVQVETLSIEEFQRRFPGIPIPEGARRIYLTPATAGTAIYFYTQDTLLSSLRGVLSRELAGLPDDFQIEILPLPAAPDLLKKPGLIAKDWLLDLPYVQALLPVIELALGREVPSLRSLVLYALRGAGGQIEAVIGDMTLKDEQGQIYHAYFV